MEKKKIDKGYKKDFKICPLVDAACCISAGGKGYDIDKNFNSWVKNYIKEKLGIKDE